MSGFNLKNIKDMSDEDLVSSYKDLYDTVYVIECYGKIDMVFLQAYEGELARRGYSIKESPSVEVTKDADDEV